LPPVTTGALLFGLVLVCAGLLALYRRSGHRRRSFFEGRLKAAAGFSWYPAATDQRLASVATRLYAADGEADRMVAGPWAQTGIRALDFTYVPSSTSTAAKCHVIAYDLPFELPPLAVLRKNPLVPSQEFESAEFNRRFTVECADPRYASAVISPPLMALLVDHCTDFEWRIEGSTLVTWGLGYWTTPLIVQAASVFDQVVARIPRFVVEDYRVR
jgi:hypothetical protein